MYLDFEDYRPEFTPVGHAISTREGVLIAFIVHLLAVIVLLLAPRYLPDSSSAARARALLLAQQRAAQTPRFVFVQPRLDMAAPKPPVRAESSDQDRMARAPERATKPTNPLPYSRGNSPERVEESQQRAQRSQPNSPGTQPSQAAPQQAQAEPPRIPDTPNALPMPAVKTPAPAARNGTGDKPAFANGALGEALNNLGKYVQQMQFDNPQGGGGQPGAAIQFDTKGVEFGPWIRRFVAQIRRNWNIPEAAWFMKGHVVITFNVHKDGSITDLAVSAPCPIDAFNHAAFGALAASNPTYPLPPEYPSDKAFFTVTFYYNEQQ
jgi:TonB family protein